MVVGGPRTGKTTLARDKHRGALAYEQANTRPDPSLPSRWLLLHTDDLMGSHSWSAASQHIADDWLNRPGPWIIEGVACARALRKWMRSNDGKPCEEVIVLETAHVDLSKGQRSMAKGCASVLAEILPELVRRGVVLSTE